MACKRNNLLKETLMVLNRHDKTFDDVKWIGLEDGSKTINVDDFIKMADKIKYDIACYNNSINTDLVIVGDTWWLERHEGSHDKPEWWEFKELPTITGESGVMRQDEIEIFEPREFYPKRYTKEYAVYNHTWDTLDGTIDATTYYIKWRKREAKQ